MKTVFQNVTWTIALQDNTIRTFQDPVSLSCIDKTVYHHSYKEFLETLDGRDMTSFVDFFFQKSPTDRTHLEFVDEDARLDFFDFLRDHNLIPDFDKISTGDWCRQR